MKLPVDPVLLVQRVTSCLSISAVQKLLHVLEIPGRPHKVLIFFWRSQNKIRERQLPRKKEAEKLEFEAWPDFRNGQDMAKQFQK